MFWSWKVMGLQLSSIMPLTKFYRINLCFRTNIPEYPISINIGMVKNKFSNDYLCHCGYTYMVLSIHPFGIIFHNIPIPVLGNSFDQVFG